MIYTVYMDGLSIFGYTNDLVLVSPSLDIELNAAGSFTFKMPKSHIYYDLPSYMTSDVEVYEDGELIWFGRVTEIDDQDMNKDKTVYCEGALAFFNDSIQRPYSFEEITLRDFFERIIFNHNTYVPENRQFSIGDITTVPDYTISESSADYSTTKDILMNECVGAYGGYLFFRKENGTNYIDWISDITELSPQSVEYAANLVTLSKFLRGSTIFTSIIPLGKEVNGSRITIASVNEGKDYLDSDLIETYGRITKVVEWSDIGEASELLSYAQTWLENQQFETLSITCDAAELYYLGKSDGPFRVGQLVHVTSYPHAVDVTLPICGMSIELDSPIKTISIGTPEKSDLTDMV